jgi:hypothetical protein
MRSGGRWRWRPGECSATDRPAQPRAHRTRKKRHLCAGYHVTSTRDLVSLMSEPLTGAETTRRLAHRSKGLKHSKRNNDNEDDQLVCRQRARFEDGNVAEQRHLSCPAGAASRYGGRTAAGQLVWRLHRLRSASVSALSQPSAVWPVRTARPPGESPGMESPGRGLSCSDAASINPGARQ